MKTSKLTTYDRATPAQRTQIRRDALSRPCESCGAKVGEHCKGIGGKKAQPHWSRRQAIRSLPQKPCRKCLCALCNRWSPLIKKIKSALRGKPEAHDFEKLTTYYFYVEDDLNYAEARLDGSWPDWEWLPEARKEAERKKAEPKPNP